MLPDARFLITGGEIDGDWGNVNGLENLTTPTCEWYDRTLQTWYYAPTLNLTRDKHRAVFLHQDVTEELPRDLAMVAGGLVGIYDPSSHYISSDLTNSVEILDVGQGAMDYYMAHQPLSASVSNSAAAAGLRVVYGANLNPRLEYRSEETSSVSLDIADVRGASVYHSTSTLDPGTSTLDLAGLRLQAGVYFVTSSSNFGTKSLKFVVSK